MQFVEIAFTVPSASSEAWADRLVEEGAPGVEERDGTTLQAAPHGKTTLVVWLAPDQAERFVERAMANASSLPEPVIARRDRDEDEWRDAWKKYFGVLRVPPFVIVPSWEKQRYTVGEGEIAIDLDPGRAFGTGGHASTRLCLGVLGAIAHRCRRVLDVGCGSGVLAIACAKRFAEATGVGVDIDPDAIEVSRENAERNGVGDRLQFSTEPLQEIEGRFDVVLANIQPEVLIPMAPLLDQRLEPNGSLVLSGILVEAAPPVVEAFQARGLLLASERDEDGWRALVFRREQR